MIKDRLQGLKDFGICRSRRAVSELRGVNNGIVTVAAARFGVTLQELPAV
jgi:hypothetical protein